MEEERINSNESVTALSNRVSINKKKQNENRVIKCFACNKMGHIAKDCFKVKRQEQGKEQRSCYWCKKPGHLMADCRLKKGKEDKKKPKQEETEENVFIGEVFASNWYKGDKQEMAFVGGQPLNETDWCMDSGASEHMCTNLNFF